MILGSLSKIIRIKSKFKIIKQDPDDDMLLRTAYDCRANYLVSGDAHRTGLLPLSAPFSPHSIPELSTIGYISLFQASDF